MTNMTEIHLPIRLSLMSKFLRRLKELRGDAGNSLVEVSLLVSFFGVPLLLGVTEVGRIAYSAIEVSNAARAGAAFASESVSTSTDTTDTKQAALNEASDITGMTVTQSTVCVCSSAPGTTVTCSSSATTCSPAPNHAIQFVQVNTSLTINPIFHMPSLPSSITLKGQETMRVGQ